MIAAREGHLGCMSLLIKAGANLWPSDVAERNAAMLAVLYGKPDALSLLIKSGALAGPVGLAGFAVLAAQAGCAGGALACVRGMRGMRGMRGSRKGSNAAMLLSHFEPRVSAGEARGYFHIDAVLSGKALALKVAAPEGLETGVDEAVGRMMSKLAGLKALGTISGRPDKQSADGELEQQLFAREWGALVGERSSGAARQSKTL